ncbi:MAG: HAD hydrolase family protein [Actinomycetota bacterium]
MTSAPRIVATDLCVRASGPGSVSVTQVRASKAGGLQVIAEHLRVPRSDVVAYGDMPADIGLLQGAGRGIAVAGAHPAVTAAADEVARAADDDGVAWHLRDLF